MASLKWQPTIAAPYTVADPVCLSGSVVGIDHSGHTRQRQHTQFVKEGIHVSRNQVEMEVGVDLPEARCLDIAPPKVWLGEYNLVDAPTSPPRLKKEVALCVGLGVTDRDRTHCTYCQVQLVND